MQTAEDDHHSPYPVPACDSCYSRKVRCDRGIPCNNCLDQNVPCLRQRNRRRLPKRTRTTATNATKPQSSSSAFPTSTADTSSPSQTPDIQLEMDDHLCNETPQDRLDTLGNGVHGEPVAPSEAATHYHDISHPRPPGTDFNLLEGKNGFQQGLIRQAQHVLQSALVNATQAVSVSKAELALDNDKAETSESVSPELLAWMLQDIGSAKCGMYVWDYFKHVSKSSLKHMGLGLFTNQASVDERDIFTVCLSAAAHKFLVTVLASGNHDDQLADHLQQRALNYKKAALAALDRIRLVTAPSLPLLQALLCGIFIHQGSGNARFAYDLTRTACRVATDLGLHLAYPRGNKAPRTEEETFCLLWCYMLDKNYSWKFEPNRCFFEPEPGVVDQHVEGTASELLTIYIIMAQVQDEALSLSKALPFTESHSAQHTSHHSTELILTKIEKVRQRIEQIALASPDCWKGLEPANEIAALRFSHNSIRTMALYLSEQSRGHALGFGELLLRSARQELSSLVSICLIGEKHRAVGFLHWTLIYYPLTAWFVLFCNTVTSSHVEDLNLLKTLATVLMPNVSLSRPITVIKQLCEDFIALSQSHFAILSDSTGTALGNVSSFQSQPLRHHTSVVPAVRPVYDNPNDPSASGIYDIYAANSAEDPAAFDLLFPNTLALEFPDDILLFDSS